ncbi:hypothetical protein AKUG0402_UNKNOWN200070 (plasmid) [Apilactobacillus kunkeei]|nr:hypothetical protein AKUG0402_UNKNOWN200070 [Apilactobacillus kunkeei]
MRASNFQTGGYSEAKYQELVGERQAYLLMGSGPVATPKFVDKRPTEEIDSIKVEIYLEGLGADRIKLPAILKRVKSAIMSTSRLTISSRLNRGNAHDTKQKKPANRRARK